MLIAVLVEDENTPPPTTTVGAGQVALLPPMLFARLEKTGPLTTR